MSSRTGNLVPQDQDNAPDQKRAIARVQKLQSAGIEGYISLGAILSDLVEKGQITELNREIASISDSQLNSLTGFSKHFYYESTKTKINKEIKRLEDDLWSRACNEGITKTLSEYQRRNDDNTRSFLSEVRKRTSFKSQLYAGIVSAFMFGLLLLAAQQIDNPLSKTVDILFLSDQELSDSSSDSVSR